MIYINLNPSKDKLQWVLEIILRKKIFYARKNTLKTKVKVLDSFK